MKIQDLGLTAVEELKLEDKLKDSGTTLELYIAKLVSRDINGIIHLENGFRFDQNTNTLYDNNINEVKLTDIELKLFKVLFENRENVVTIEQIHAIAWKGKNMTRFTLRNKIKTLRDKTYYELIKNHSNIGYSMN